MRDTMLPPNESSNDLNTCLSCHKELNDTNKGFVCNLCVADLSKEFSDQGSDTVEDYYEPEEELPDDDSELLSNKLDEWAEDDEILKADLDDEVFGDYIENKVKDDSGHDLCIEEQEVSGLDNMFVHISELAKTVVYKLTAKHEGSMPVDDVRKIQLDILRVLSSSGVDLDDPQSVDLFCKKFREFDERLFEEFEKNFDFLCNMTVGAEIAAQGFSDVVSGVSEKNDGVGNPPADSGNRLKYLEHVHQMLTYDPMKEPEYPALSEAAWSLTIAVVSGFIGFMFWPSFIATFIAGWNWFRIRSESQFSIERDAQTAFRIKREKWEEEQRIAGRAKEREERCKRDEEAYVTRRQLRVEIEKMPKYSNWRNAVFARCGRVCEMCGETKGLEIHHRVSFDAIQRAYKINTIVQAFDCDALWNVNNGSVLCKRCHEKMESSKYRNLHS